LSKLTDLLKNKFESSKDPRMKKEARTLYSYESGLDILDYKNGKKIIVNDKDSYDSLGFDEGTYVMIIGDPGTAKTTLAIQMGKNIVDKYENSQMFLLDPETATNESRVKSLTKWNRKTMEEKFIHKDEDITHELFYELIKSIADVKKEHREDIEIVTDRLNSKGNKITMLPPTVVILDSLALLIPDKMSEEEKMSGQMSQTAIAKNNAQIFRRIMKELKVGNIILFVINHITENVNINPMVPKKAKVNYLKQDESIPGGRTSIYLAKNIIKLETSSKLTSDKEFGFDGFVSKATFIKSRTNKGGQIFEMIYNQNEGFSNVLSNYHNLKQLGHVKGAGRGFYLENCPEVKFSQKDFLNKYKDNKELRIAMKKLVKTEYSKFILEDDFETSNKDDTENKTSKSKKKNKDKEKVSKKKKKK